MNGEVTYWNVYSTAAGEQFVGTKGHRSHEIADDHVAASIFYDTRNIRRVFVLKVRRK